MTQATVFQAIAPRPAPIPTQGAVAWLRANLFSSPLNSLMTLAMGALLLYYLPQVWQWAVSNAVWTADADQCRAARGVGACWGIISEKHRVILFGHYPNAEQWRPLLATLLMVVLLVISCMRQYWRKSLVVVWLINLSVCFSLMRGGLFVNTGRNRFMGRLTTDVIAFHLVVGLLPFLSHDISLGAGVAFASL